MTALDVPAEGSPDPGEPELVAALWQRIDRLHATVERVVAEREAAWDRVEELTARCTRMAAQVPLRAPGVPDGARLATAELGTDTDVQFADVQAADVQAADVQAAERQAAERQAAERQAAEGRPMPGLAAALTGEAGPVLAAAVAAAVGNLSGLSRTAAALEADAVDAVVDVGCVADLPDGVLVDLAAAGQRLAAWGTLASTVAAGELAHRWEKYPPEDGDRLPGTGSPGMGRSRDLGFRAAAAEIATGCLLTEHTVAARIDATRAVPIRLPRLWHLVATGVVDLDRARLIHEKTLALTTDTLTGLEPQLVIKATTLTMPQLRVWLERAIAAADPQAYARQAREAHDHRGVSFRAAGHGMGRMAVTGSLADIETARIVVTALAAMAQDDPGHERLPDAKRADTVLDLIAAALDPDPDPDGIQTDDTQAADSEATGADDGTGTDDLAPTGVAAGTDDAATAEGAADESLVEVEQQSAVPRTGETAPTTSPHAPPCLNRAAIERFTGTRVHITVPLSVILGGDGLGEIGNDGPLPADQVRDLLAALQRMGTSATWRCLITDDDPYSPTHGTVLGIGRAPHALVRTATGLLRELVQARARCCTFPGCRRQAIGCQVDHRIPHRDGGATCECNLHPLCAHHHRLRERGFTPEVVIPRPRSGSSGSSVRGRAGPVITRWTTPTGRTITTHTEHPPF
ncbi:MAG: hypothetical protein U0Q19_07950 [Kineosporiaceae bacterium]